MWLFVNTMTLELFDIIIMIFLGAMMIKSSEEFDSGCISMHCSAPVVMVYSSWRGDGFIF